MTIVCSGSWLCENHSAGCLGATSIRTECRSRMKDSAAPRARIFCCAPLTGSSVFTQPGSFATGLSQQQVQPCPLCPDSDQIPHRSEMSRCAMSGSRVLSLPITKFSVAWHPDRGWCASVRQVISWGQFDASICRSAPRCPPFDGSISRMANCARSPSRELPASSRWRGFVSRMQRVPTQQPLLRING